MKTRQLTLMIFILMGSKPLWAENSPQDIHRYWTCAIRTYDATMNGKYQQSQCRANTAYSAAPCREFFVEYAGAKGIRPDKPYEQKLSAAAISASSDDHLPTTINISIAPEQDQFSYQHSIEQQSKSGINRWHYQGRCQYNEAPASEKIHLDEGLQTVP